MTWLLSRVGQRCGSCRETIPAASPVLRLSSGLVRCVGCAKRLLDQEPPARLAAHDRALTTAAALAPTPGPTSVSALVVRLRERLEAAPVNGTRLRPKKGR